MKALILRAMSWWVLFLLIVVAYNVVSAVIWSASTDPVGFLLGLIGLSLGLAGYAIVGVAAFGVIVVIVAIGNSPGGLGQLLLSADEKHR